jgi:hypothetical protein
LSEVQALTVITPGCACRPLTSWPTWLRMRGAPMTPSSLQRTGSAQVPLIGAS